MARDGFRWVVGQAAPKIESHSNAKLELLAAYLDRYFETVASQPQIDNIAITLVDGFSGGGQYQRYGEERPGSPLVLLEAVNRAQTHLNVERRKPLSLDAKFYFVDAEKSAIGYLQQTLIDKGYGDDIKSGRIVLLRGEFEKQWEEVLAGIRSRQRAGRSLFVLDQKGWNKVQFTTIRTILSDLPKAEVLLTFAVDWLMSYLNEGTAFALAMSKAGFHGKQVAEYLEARGAPGYQYFIPRLLARDIQELTGAPFFTPFFLRSKQADRDLWLVHLSKIVTARNVMVESHWSVGNTSQHRGPAGLNMLGFDPHWEDGAALDFGFDARASADIRLAMADELPYRIEAMERGGVPTVMQVIGQIANQTAATRDQIEETIKLLHGEKQIELLNSDGAPRRKSSRPVSSDFIRLSRQLIIPGSTVPR
ncbi:three-Cys-motif partner protein TcmP [Devosia sp. BK]|uniref:three-Cys-motif partner protein TcmP n=1 Tax=Devosia sp. BK TaxID=2871706 RepID=UPI00293A1CC8|nr:three-Cys-motif partner protein TcmP [Devosia sp. BK]MDV3253563.1 three-Cys-motif partner protein TcmP [Devosia sp. BK]